MAEKVTFKLPAGTKVKYSGVILELVDAVMVTTQYENWQRIEVHGKRPDRESEQEVLELNKE